MRPKGSEIAEIVEFDKEHEDPKNLSERNLRLIALGRKNFLFVGNDQAGENLAILQSPVATCIAHEVNPQDFIADVLMRIQDHPQSAIDELMPHRWTPRD